MTWQENLRTVTPYVAGEQPKMIDMIKLNTNENPYPPSPQVQQTIESFASERLRLYPDSDANELREALADYYQLKPEQVFLGNGSDEVLSLSFLTFFNSSKPLLLPDISYSFYPIYCDLYRIPYQEIPVDKNFKLNIQDYFQENGGIVIANPNAPTGLSLDLKTIETLLRNNTESIVLIDEAYIDFGGVSAIPLLEKYDNLIIVQTFSKSRSLAGIRLGIALGNALTISHLYDVKNSFNSYPLDRLAQAIGLASLNDELYFRQTVSKIIAERERFSDVLRQLGFSVTDSKTNFVFVKPPLGTAQALFEALYEAKIIIRYWNKPKISDWLRITIGTEKEMNEIIKFLKKYLQKLER